MIVRLDNSGAINHPSTLISAYTDLLNVNGLLSKAKSPPENSNPIGGYQREETQEHFCHRFLNGCARIFYVFLKDEGDFQAPHLSLMSTFYTGTINVVDVPCGASVGSLSLLYSIVSFQERNIIPKSPMNINIFCADFSDHALYLSEEMYQRLSYKFLDFGIRINVKTIKWDASSDVDTASLCDAALLKQDSDARFILVTDFSGIGMDAMKKYDSTFKQITSRIQSVGGEFLWIEPISGKSNKLLQWIEDYIIDKKYLKKLFHYISPSQKLGFKFMWNDPLTTRSVNSGVRIVRHFHA